MPLPSSCDESTVAHLPSTARVTYGFFLAETSLRSILHQLRSIPEEELWPSTYIATASSVVCTPKTSSPASSSRPTVVEELERQLETWLDNVPSFLRWSQYPDHTTHLGVVESPSDKNGFSGIAVRLRILYWYARFLLHKGSFTTVVRSQVPDYQYLSLEPFQQKVVHAITQLFSIYLLEDPNIDVLMAHRSVNKHVLADDHIPLL